MTTRTEIRFREDRADAVEALESVAGGRGWCNVIPVTVDDEPELRLNVFGLWINKGVTVASLVTSPDRAGLVRPSSLGLLHTRGRLGAARIRELTGGAWTVLQDHSQRGLLLELPGDTPAAEILDVMASMTAALCDYEMTGAWRLDRFLR